MRIVNLEKNKIINEIIKRVSGVDSPELCDGNEQNKRNIFQSEIFRTHPDPML